MTTIIETEANGVQRDGHGRFLKGSASPSPGRPAGTPNRYTAELRDMIREALDRAGGVEYLTEQAERNPAMFLRLVGALLPHEVRAQLAIATIPSVTVHTYVRQDEANAYHLIPATVSPVPIDGVVNTPTNGMVNNPTNGMVVGEVEIHSVPEAG